MGGRAKAALALPSGETFLARIAATARAAGVTRLVVVRGALPVEAPPGALTVVNPDPDRGMLSSLQAGLQALLDAVPGAPPARTLLWPVDCPRVPAAVVEALLEAIRDPSDVATPSHARRAGHPVAFGAAAARALLEAPTDAVARALLRAPALRHAFVEVDAPEVLDDVDTPEDLAAMCTSDRRS